MSFRKFHARIIVKVPKNYRNCLSIVIWYEEPLTRTSYISTIDTELRASIETKDKGTKITLQTIIITIIWLLSTLSTHLFYDNNNNNHRMMKGFNKNNNNNNRKHSETEKGKGNFNGNILIMNHPFQLHAVLLLLLP